MHLLVDADSLCYRAGFVCNEPDQENLAIWQIKGLVERILAVTQPDSFQLYLTGSNNFRYDIYPEYKANRVGMARPVHLQAMREYLITDWKSAITDGIEADDAVGIAAYATEDEVLLAHIDKDLDLFAGKHFNYNKEEFYEVGHIQAQANFYMQLIQGDKGDNIPGYDGKMRPKLPQFLYPVRDQLYECGCQEEMFDIVLGYYQESVEKMDLSARLLWLQRKEDDDWTNYLDPIIMEELGRKDDLTALLQARSAPPLENGLLNISV